MKGLCVLSFLFVFVVTINAWEGRLLSDPDTEKLGYCYMGRATLIGSLKLNETKRIEGQCAVVQCEEDRSIKIIGCPIVNIPKPCKILPGDLTKPHPDCCYDIECPNKKN